MKTDIEQAAPRRTKRRYAHELYPHAKDGETRPLAVEVPYLYARVIGLEVLGTGWLALLEEDDAGAREASERLHQLSAAGRFAFLADAVHQGMTGEEAWAWADRRSWGEAVESAYTRAKHYGVPVEQIKPYPFGPESDHHDSDCRGANEGAS